MNRPKLKIEVFTAPNGYVLKVGNKEYLYFTVEQLIGGFFTRVGIEETEILTREMVESLMVAAATWKTVGEAYAANASLMANAKKAQSGENAALRGQAAANERAEKAESECKRLREKNIELQTEVLELKQSMDRIGATIVGAKKTTRVVIEDVDKLTKGQKQIVKESKKKGKSRYARKG